MDTQDAYVAQRPKSSTGIARRARRSLLVAVLGGALVASPIASAWADVAPSVRSQSTTQMSSEPELVYVNEVNDPALRVQDFNGNWKFILDDPAGAEARSSTTPHGRM